MVSLYKCGRIRLRFAVLSVIIGAIVITLLISSVNNVLATGIRYDWSDDATDDHRL